MSTVGHGMFSYIPDASMIGDPHSHLNLPARKSVTHHHPGTVFCNFIANAMCVVHSVIDVEVELTVLSPPHPSSRLHVSIPLKISFPSSTQDAEFNAADTACKSRSNYTLAEGSNRKLSFFVGGLQIGQPKHFLFSKVEASSFSVRAVAIVDGTTAVAISVSNPPPRFPLLIEQRALVTYFEAVRFLSFFKLHFRSLCFQLSSLEPARVRTLPAQVKRAVSLPTLLL